MNRIMAVWLILPAILAGCGSGVKMTGDPRTQLNAGYAALYDVVKRNSGVMTLLAIKNESQSVNAAIAEVADLCKQATAKLDEFQLADPSLEYDRMGLPVIDAAARLGIDNQTTAALLFANGRRFEVQLLYAQLRATSYMAAVADALAGSDANADRQQYLRKLSKDFAAVNQRLFKLLAQVTDEPDTPVPQALPGAAPQASP